MPCWLAHMVASFTSASMLITASAASTGSLSPCAAMRAVVRGSCSQAPWASPRGRISAGDGDLEAATAATSAAIRRCDGGGGRRPWRLAAASACRLAGSVAGMERARGWRGGVRGAPAGLVAEACDVAHTAACAKSSFVSQVVTRSECGALENCREKLRIPQLRSIRKII
eukprot:365580-Chlamydomonas_euryale.AAC.4